MARWRGGWAADRIAARGLAVSRRATLSRPDSARHCVARWIWCHGPHDAYLTTPPARPMARNREMVLGWNSQRWKPPMEPRPSLASPRSSRCDDDRELLRSLAGSHRSSLSRLRFHLGAYMASLVPAADRKWQLGYRHSARKGSVGLRASQDEDRAELLRVKDGRARPA